MSKKKGIDPDSISVTPMKDILESPELKLSPISQEAHDNLRKIIEYYCKSPERLGTISDFLDEICKDDEKNPKI